MSWPARNTSARWHVGPSKRRLGNLTQLDRHEASTSAVLLSCTTVGSCKINFSRSGDVFFFVFAKDMLDPIGLGSIVS
jgi:hypothetical protein